MSDQNQDKVVRPHFKFKLARDRDPRVLAILKFIKSNQTDNYGITMDKVANYMNDKGFCSRPTTRILVSSLLEEGILEEKERRNKYFHDLVVKEDYPFEAVLGEIFLSHVYDIEESFRPFETLLKGKEEGKEVRIRYNVDKSPKDETIFNLTIALMKQIYTPKQMQKIQSDFDHKMIRKHAKRPKKDLV